MRKEIVLQKRIKRLGCIWKDHNRYDTIDHARSLNMARAALVDRRTGALGETSYTKKREWRVVVREIVEHVIE